MSKCISHHGEYSEHRPGREGYCELCGDLDMEAHDRAVKADALREWSGRVQMELAASASHGIDLGEDFLHGAHSMLKQAGEFADRIEEEA